jgi:hypothetical protein
MNPMPAHTLKRLPVMNIVRLGSGGAIVEEQH